MAYLFGVASDEILNTFGVDVVLVCLEGIHKLKILFR